MNQSLKYTVDLVLCIDATGSMSPVIEAVKSNALKFYTDLIQRMDSKGKHIDVLRVKVIVFRDFFVDGLNALKESPFYVLPESINEFSNFISPINADGGVSNDGDISSDVFDEKTRRWMGNVFVTAINYLWERQSDANKSSLSFFKPAELVFNLLNMQYDVKEGTLKNPLDEVVCFDPSAIYPTQSCLLVRKEDLVNKLEDEGLDVIWTILGEKNILGRLDNNYIGRLDISGVVSSDFGTLKYFPSFYEERPDKDR